jgi:predicted HAD superfamily phosphohydrolase
MRKQTRRKIWDTTVNPITHAIVGASITDEESLEILRVKERGSLQAFRNGTATARDWNNINAVVQLAESMAAAGIGPEVMVHVKIAEMHLIDAHDRYKRIGKMGSTGPGLQSFQDIIEYHQLQRTSVSRSVYERHIKRVTDMIRSKSPKIKFL